MNIAAIILTFNEEIHIGRCIDSLLNFTNQILIVDSYSTDQTLDIARNKGVNIIQHHWVNYASQFNWALTQLDLDVDWVLRIDADEFLTPELISEIISRVPMLPASVSGVYWGRRMTFQRRMIRYGGIFPVHVIRLFRYGRGKCENRWMDEHIKVIGSTVQFRGEMIDDNLNSLTWWTDKHNKYACREVVDLLNLEYRFIEYESIAKFSGGGQASIKRWLKEVVYAQLPGGFRSLAYFLYRYLIRLGFLDGKHGWMFHFLQGFWYRYLVDAKLHEVKRYMSDNNCSIEFAIEKVLGIKL